MRYKLERMKAFQLLIIVPLFLSILSFVEKEVFEDERFITYTVDAGSLSFFWKDERGQPIRSLQNLKSFVESKKQKLVFAMNGGMFKPDNSPQGLFIQDFQVQTPIDTSSGAGNFYLKPNGVFYITNRNVPVICKTPQFPEDRSQIKFATQSGPMLVVDSKIHPAFIEGSSNLHIRNGVGILPDNKVVFVMSKKEINFYDFASYFKSLGCKNALYLDGFVSRTYLPEQNWLQTDGNFGVMIGVTK
jgi:uncharacterized protein YigE (DUF2233 family)